MNRVYGDFTKKYSTKIQALFELGKESLRGKVNLKIYEKFKFTKDDTDELIELATYEAYNLIDDDKLIEKFFFATIHAVNVLGKIKAVESIDIILEKK